MKELPKELQHTLAQFQQVQQQAEAIATQRLQLEVQLKDVEKALEEVEKLPEDGEVYKVVGNLLVKSEKGKVEAELRDRKETLELRVKTLKKQEEKVATRLKELQQKIQAGIQRSGIGQSNIRAG